MQDATESNDKGTVTRGEARARVVSVRTQAFSALLLFVVFWTSAVWFYRERYQSAEGQIPGDLVVDLNDATAAELNLLPGVGEKLASDILKYRDEIGGFHSVDDLKNIRGIKEARLSSLRKHVTVRSESQVISAGRR